MTPEDDQDFSNSAEAEVERHVRWLRWLVAFVVLLVLAATVAAWALRKSVAERTLASWCAERALVCTARFERLGSDGATVRQLMVRGEGQVAFEAEEVRVHLEWPDLFTPRVTAVDIETPVVHGALADGRLGFHGLERLIPSEGSGGGGEMPALDIQKGRILIATSAGEVGATVSVNGTFPQTGKASLTLDPESLDGPQGHLKWSGGKAEFTAENGRIAGQADLTLEEVQTDDVRVSNARLTANVEAGFGAADPARVLWEGRVDQASGADFDFQNLVASGQARLDALSSTSPEDLLGGLTEADIQLEAGAAHWTGYATGPAQFEASLRGKDGALSGPVEISLTDVSIPQGRVGQFQAAGDLGWTGETGFRFAGPVTVSKASLTEDLTDDVLQKLAFPAPLTAHGESLRSALRRALSDFNARGQFTILASGDTLRIGGQDAASLDASSGLVLTVEPQAGESWLSMNGSQIRISGDAGLKGGGAPTVSASIKLLTVGTDGVTLSTGPVKMSSWTVDRIRFGADITSATVRSGSGDVSIMAAGALTLAGPVFGLDLADSRLSGGIQVLSEPDGLKVEPLGEPCLRFDTKGVGLGGVNFRPTLLKLCPRSKVFMNPGKGQATGTASLGDVSWPFASKSVTGTLGLQNAVLDWSAKKGFAFTISSPDLDLPLDIEGRVLTIDAASPRVSLSTAKGQVPRLSATLSDTALGGTLIPAKVSAGQISFDGEIRSGGLSGDLAGDSVLIRDFRDDPVYQPLLADLTARMDEWQLALSGPLRLEESGALVGDISSNINVLSLNGTAHVATRPLDFQKGGLQPVMLSERLRGVYTDAAGQMSAASDVTITNGKLTGTADVTVANFGFQTTRLGRVANVNGHVHFADLFSLSTDPSQVLTIGSMNPGVPLTDGRIVFRFTEGKVLAVESASFPFSGGTLALSPFEWTLGGETQHVEVTADAIDLEELVRTLKLPKVEAEGTVSGRFPIDVERTKVLIRDARLFADPGGGRVAYLGDAADSASKSDANVRLAFEALKDFDFTVLEVGLDGNIADRVKITLKLAGKSRNDITYGSGANIVRGQPFEFNIGIDSALAELFRSSQFYTNQQKVTDFVVHEVLTENGLKPAEDE